MDSVIVFGSLFPARAITRHHKEARSEDATIDHLTVLSSAVFLDKCEGVARGSIPIQREGRGMRRGWAQIW